MGMTREQSKINKAARAKAKAEGDTRYDNGMPCANGHMAKRYVNNGQCCECLRLAVKKWDDNTRLDPERLDAIREKKRIWAQEHRDKYGDAHREYMREYMKGYVKGIRRTERHMEGK